MPCVRRFPSRCLVPAWDMHSVEVSVLERPRPGDTLEQAPAAELRPRALRLPAGVALGSGGSGEPLEQSGQRWLLCCVWFCPFGRLRVPCWA